LDFEGIVAGRDRQKTEKNGEDMVKVGPWQIMTGFCTAKKLHFSRPRGRKKADLQAFYVKNLRGIGADAGFAAGERVALAVEPFVLLIVLLAESAEVGLALPAVDGEVGAGDVSVTEQLGAEIVGRCAEELGPGALGAIGGLKTGNFIFSNFKLPDDDEHR